MPYILRDHNKCLCGLYGRLCKNNSGFLFKVLIKSRTFKIKYEIVDFDVGSLFNFTASSNYIYQYQET